MLQLKFKSGVAGVLHLRRFWTADGAAPVPNWNRLIFPCRNFPDTQKESPAEIHGAFWLRPKINQKVQRALVAVTLDDHLLGRLLALFPDHRGVLVARFFALDHGGAVTLV